MDNDISDTSFHVRMMIYQINNCIVLVKSIVRQAETNQNLIDLSVFYVPICYKILNKIKKSYLFINQNDIVNKISNIYISISECIQILNDFICRLTFFNHTPIKSNFFHSKMTVENTLDSYKDIKCIFEQYLVLLINKLL